SSFGSTQQLALKLAMLAHHKRRTSLGHAKHQTQSAEVAILDPQLICLDEIEHGRDQAALLSMAILTQHHIGDQHALLIQDHESLPWQGGGPGATQLVEAVLGRGEVIAIEHLDLIAGYPTRVTGSQRLDHRFGELGRVTYQSSRHPSFNPIE